MERYTKAASKIAMMTAFASLFGTFAHAQASPPLRNLVVQGSSSTMRLLKGDAARFANDNKIGVSVTETQSLMGMNCVLEGKCDLAISNIPINDPRVSGNALLEETVYGLDCSTLITHPSAGVENLTTVQVKDVLQGNVINWKQVGGEDVPIMQFRRDLANGGRDAEFFGVESAGGTIVKASSEAINRTRVTRGGFASSGLGIVQDMEKKGELKILKINGYAPSPENLRSGKYPYLRKLYIVRRKDKLDDESLSKLTEFFMKVRPQTFEKSGIVMP